MEWRYERPTEREHIKLYDGEDVMGSVIVERDREGRIKPERTVMFVKTYKIALEEFYRSVFLAPGIRKTDRDDLIGIVGDMKIIGMPEESERIPMMLAYKGLFEHELF